MGHASHADCAVDGWYSPASQPAHATPLDDVVPGSHVVRDDAPLADAVAAFDPAAAAKMCGECDDKPPVTLVFFVGGVTFAEVAALRWLGRNSTPRREYLVATTNLTTGDTMMESLIATCENQLESID